ncbi:MAG TPA: RNA-binding cell elongation regulator Jag/EloR [Ktedonobacterales bacterium]|nr:RNA-binding cell elongation regulator Jag/EloR [Ktedonobacterales bacterium]
MESVETSGKSIEDAILLALARLGRNRDEVEIVVLQEPRRGGARGQGPREARVRVFLKPDQPTRPTTAPQGDDDDYDDEAYEVYTDLQPAEDLEELDDYDSLVEQGFGQELITAALSDALPPEATAEDVAIEALRMILGHMGIRCEIEALEPVGDELLILNIVPVDNQPLSLLIGRRGETLAALQLIINMIVSKQAGRHERVIVDAEGYRQRREENLRVMAERIAEQVRRTGNPVTLEAMSPNERRLIHLALADYADISSDSIGEGDQRRVVVALKRR